MRWKLINSPIKNGVILLLLIDKDNDNSYDNSNDDKEDYENNEMNKNENNRNAKK